MICQRLSIFFLFLTILNLGVEAQDSYWGLKQAKADTIITDMKSSILLIQLNTESVKTKSRYARPGSHSIITNSFKLDFDFCNVLFYYASDSTNVFNHSFNLVSFYDHNLDIISDDSLIDQSTYIGVFGRIQEDSARNFDGYYYVEGPNGTEKRARYSHDPEDGYTALVLYDDNGMQLPRPLPFNVRTYDANFVKRNPITVIKKMNTKLNLYYQKRKIQSVDK